jgi:hypothetical protein
VGDYGRADATSLASALESNGDYRCVNTGATSQSAARRDDRSLVQAPDHTISRSEALPDGSHVPMHECCAVALCVQHIVQNITALRLRNMWRHQKYSDHTSGGIVAQVCLQPRGTVLPDLRSNMRHFN